MLRTEVPACFGSSPVSFVGSLLKSPLAFSDFSGVDGVANTASKFLAEAEFAPPLAAEAFARAGEPNVGSPLGSLTVPTAGFFCSVDTAGGVAGVTATTGFAGAGAAEVVGFGVSPTGATGRTGVGVGTGCLGATGVRTAGVAAGRFAARVGTAVVGTTVAGETGGVTTGDGVDNVRATDGTAVGTIRVMPIPVRSV